MAESPAGPHHDPLVPLPRELDFPWMSLVYWKERHAAHCALAQQGGVDLLLMGDSITQGWETTAAWRAHFAQYRSANFGIGGDAAHNLLWRLQNGATGKLQPRLVVLLIGINNLGREAHSPAETASAIAAVLGQLRSSFPGARILLHGVLPADREPGTATRQRIQELNTKLAALADEGTVLFRDLGPVLLDAQGLLSAEIAPDELHLSEQGYARWAERLAPEVTALLAPAGS